MSRLIILTAQEQQQFEQPPHFTDRQRRTYFLLPASLQKIVDRLQTKANKIFFLVQFAYFKACQQFFDPHDFLDKDLVYAAQLMGFDSISRSDVNAYRNTRTVLNHQKRILDYLGYRLFNEDSRQRLILEVRSLVEKQISPKKIFLMLLKSLQERCVAFPSYHALSKFISDAFLSQENSLLEIVKSHFSDQNKIDLELLLKQNQKTKQILISDFKYINQSIKPKAIQASVALFDNIKCLFKRIEHILEALNLHEDSIKYYATWVKKAKLSQLLQMTEPHNRHLHLMCFLQHQVYLRQDYLVDILLKSVRSVSNSAKKKLLESEKSSRQDKQIAIHKINIANTNKSKLIDKIRDITASSDFDNDSQKIRAIEQLLNVYQTSLNEQEIEDLQKYEDLLAHVFDKKALYDHLEAASIKLQNRVKDILQTLVFNASTSDNVLYQAVQLFVENKGQCHSESPIGFLSKDEQAVLLEKNKFRSSLYIILLFIHVADGIRSGKLNLKYSYRYKAIQDYLISDAKWENKKHELLAAARLSEFSDIDKVLSGYKEKLTSLYDTVNRRHRNDLNPYLKINEQGEVVSIRTPAQEKKETEYVADLLSQHKFIPILQVLKDIESITQLSHCFNHHSNKAVKRRPSIETFFAGIIGLGCNIGIPKMGKVATGINPNTLSNTVNWYFSLKNLRKTNNNIVQYIHELALSEIFVTDADNTHSSSDGHKINVKVDSLVASLSFKYFGKDKGVSVYTFIDERQALFHSLVMSASEREAAYVYDGLLDNEVEQYDIHSTDTHGYREGIFAAAPFMGISYAPRIKNIVDQKIYSFSAKKTYEAKGYKVLPSGQINQCLIRENWDNIMRFMATMKLKEATASQLFKRLSSYAKHHPLYRALKEFGRIIKSIFILKFYDDLSLRQRIEKQLNRIELSNKFARAVFFANDGEFSQAEIDDQAIATACKVIIQNAVVLWNYLYLSQLLTNCASSTERTEMISLISQGSVITWRHINLYGEYDFRRSAANESTFNMSKILSLSL